MRVKSAKFIKSYADPTSAELKSLAPQICVAGRSNCGKSTLLNALMGARLCKTSQTPGHTQLVNVFEVACDTRTFYLTDLPGYGFSQAQKSRSDDFSRRTEAYFNSGAPIAQALCLMDIRRDPSDLDKVLINYLRDMGLPFTVVLTKSDKLKRSQISNAVIKIAAALGSARDNLIVTSGLDKSGREDVLNRIEQILEVD